MLERISEGEAADVMAVCSGATRAFTNIIRFGLQMKQHQQLVSAQRMNNVVAPNPFVADNFLWQGNIFDLSYYWAQDCDTISMEAINRLSPDIQVKVKANLNELYHKGYITFNSDKTGFVLTEKGKEIAFNPDFVAKAAQSSQSTVLQVQKYLEQNFMGTLPKTPTGIDFEDDVLDTSTEIIEVNKTKPKPTPTKNVAEKPVANSTKAAKSASSETVATNAVAGQMATKAVETTAQVAKTSGEVAKTTATTAATAGKTAATATTTAAAGASTCGVGAAVAIAAEMAKKGIKFLENLSLK